MLATVLVADFALGRRGCVATRSQASPGVQLLSYECDAAGGGESTGAGPPAQRTLRPLRLK
jgi:hypothetical protein